MRDDRLYLNDILDAMQSIEQFVEGMKFEEFVKDDKAVSAVIRKFEIIGEAAKHVLQVDRLIGKGRSPWAFLLGFFVTPT